MDGFVLLPDGRRLGYTDTGGRGAPVFLYLHGNPGSRHEALRPAYLAAFAKARYRVIAIDRPGYGDSDPPRQRGHAPLASDIEGLLDQLRIPTALAIGNSRGSLPAIALGALLSHRVKAIGAFGATGLPDDPSLLKPLHGPARLTLQLVKFAPALPRALLKVSAWMDRRFPAGAVSRLAQAMPSSADREQLREVGQEWVDALAAGMRRDPAFAVADWRSWLVDPLGFDLAAVDVPVLLWTGEDDRTCPPARMPHMASRIPGALTHTLAGIGHLHSPETLLALMRATLAAASG